MVFALVSFTFSFSIFTADKNCIHTKISHNQHVFLLILTVFFSSYFQYICCTFFVTHNFAFERLSFLLLLLGRKFFFSRICSSDDKFMGAFFFFFDFFC